MFTYETSVRYEDLDSTGLVKPTAIMNYLQNATVTHSESVGYGVYRMHELDLAWVVMCWDVKLGRRIRWNEKLTVHTWPYAFRGSIGKRCFEILAEDGEMLAQANSWWALIRLSDQTMVDTPPEMAEAFGVDGKPPFSLRRPRGKTQMTEEAFPVHRFDIDTNGHVNNSRFAEMACAYVPQPERIREWMIEYKHPGFLGEKIVPSYTADGTGVYVCLSCQEDERLYIKMQVQYE